MKKNVIILSLALVALASPFAFATQATDSGWKPTAAVEAWNHGDYRVERLSFKSGVVGPVKLGDQIFVAEPVDSCRPNFCDRYDLWRLENGMKLFVGNVPASVLDANRFTANGNRLVYANASDLDAQTYSIVERNLESGATNTLIDSVFLNGAQNVDVLVEGAYVYLNPEFTFQTDSNGQKKYRQATTMVWDSHWHEALSIGGKRWQMRREEVLDVNNGVVLVKMVFENGNKELWLMDSNTNQMKAVPGSWIEPQGDVQAAHFLDNGSVEYFAYFTRHLYDPKTDTTAQKYPQHLVSWLRSPKEAVQIVGNRMAWVNPDDRLFLSQNGTVTDLGVVPNGRFTLEETQLGYATPSALQFAAAGSVSAAQGKIVSFMDGSVSTTPFAPTDVRQGIAAGIDATNYAWYQNLQTGQSLRLGFGSNAYVSDARHVYWKGLDGIYEATINTAATSKLSTMRAVRVPGTDTVYLTDGATRKTIPNEPVFYSWFKSFAEVVAINQATLLSIPDAGMATFAPGAKVKVVNDPKVYVVGVDGKFHWLTSPAVAHAIYGEEWNRNIIEARLDQTLQVPFGGNIAKEADFQAI